MPTARWPVAVALLLAAAVVRAEPPAAPDTADDEKFLKQAGVAADGPALVEFFRKRVPADVTREELAALVKQLGDDDFAAREKASERLRALGARALPALRRAAQDADPEVRRRAEDCLGALVTESAAARTAAAARVIAVRKPAGGAAALIAFLPFAEDEAVADEVLSALVAVGAPGGQINAAVSAALTDREPARRAAAALLLGRHGTTGQKAAVRKLLADPDPAIRLRAAQGLLAGREKAAVPVLLALLAEAPPDVAGPADDLLHRAAGDAAPAVGPGDSPEQRAKCRAAWEGWWKANESKLDLARADVDLQEVNPMALARETARRMMDAWFVKGDPATAKRLAEPPFSIAGEMSFATRQELDKFIDEIHEHNKARKATLTYRQAVTVDDYLRGRGRRGGDAEDKQLAKVRKADVRVVYMDIAYDGNKETYGVYVRLSGGRARVFGLGIVRDGK